MPALTIPSPTTTGSVSPTGFPPHTHTDANEATRSRSRSRSQSPDRPPISPLTPTVSGAQLPVPEPPESPAHTLPPPLTTTFKPTFKQPPPSVPISESENPDAIALRSAISLLQLQREKSKRDLKTLEELKSAAVSDPQAFVRSLQEQQSRSSKQSTDILSPTLSDAASLLSNGNRDKIQERNESGRQDSGNPDMLSEEIEDKPATEFAAIPTPQNIIRCPPINWAKYHIVGEPLDKMHEEQKRWPGSAEPPRTVSGARAPSHTIAAPYSPFSDGVVEPRRTSTKKSPS